MSSTTRRASVTLLQSLTLSLLFCSLAFAQSFTASIRGTTKDPSGASIPGASVSITDVDRGTSQTTLADEEGRFAITALPPGQYVLTVEAAGFKKFSSSRFALAVQQQATIDARLDVGAVSETLEVSGSAALVNTTIANLGQVIDNQTIVSLPNLGRNPMAFTYLTPGVVGSGGRPGDSNTNFVANGSRNSTSDVLLDGVTVVTVEQNSGVTDLKYSPAVDAVQEFKVQTNFFSAEFGQTGGAVVNMVIKSGTNNFNGTGYYFLRNSALNANNWFTNRAGREKPYYRRDQVGGVLGGPLIRNKTFFFVTYEYTESKNPLSSTRTVPTLLQRQGDFSETRNAAGQVMTIYNPFDTFVNAQGNLERRPFAGNRIPLNMLDPIALRALNYFPLPNVTSTSITDTNNWFGQGLSQDVNRQMNFKIDQNFSARNRLTGRYSYAPYTNTPPNIFGEQGPAFPLNNGPIVGSAHSFVTEFTRTQSSTSLWSVRYGLTYAAFIRDPLEHYNLTELGLPQYMKNQATFDVFPRFAPDGYSPIGTEGWLKMDRQEGVHHFSGSYTKVMGGHNFKAGAESRFNFLDYAQPGYPSGQFTFGRGITCRDRFTCPGNEGNGVATMLLGWPTGGDFHIDPKVYTRSAYWGFYAHDDWRVSQKLTLNLGLRYDFDVPRWETQDRMSYWDLEAQSPVVVPGYDTRGVIKFVDSNKRSPFDADMNNVQPRYRLRLRARSQDVDQERLRIVLHAQPGHRFRPHGRRVQRQLDPHFHARLQCHALRDARQPVSERHAAAAGQRARRPHVHRSECRHHPAQQQPQPRVPLMERVGPARGRLELGPRDQLHGQPRHAPVHPAHDPDPAGSAVLVDGADGVERRRAESVLRRDHRSARHRPQRADHPAVPAAAADAPLQRRQRGHRRAAARRLFLSCDAGEVGQAFLARPERAVPLHVVADDRQRLTRLGQRQLARRLDQHPEHLGPGGGALALGT